MPDVDVILFRACFFILFYTYAGYPLMVFILVKTRNFTGKKQNFPPGECLPVTLVIAAYNEEKIIEKKIRNCLDLNYPPGLLEVLFVTDGSSDNTFNILNEYKGITVLHIPERQGKPSALNRAMIRVTTPIVVFSDANTLLNKDAIKHITGHYANPEVGGVAGEKRIMKEGSGTVKRGEGLYWRYESGLKKLDSSLKSVVGAAGELFSVRSNLYTPLPDNTIIEDFVQSLLVCVKGSVVRYEPRAWAEENASLSVRDEMERKIRISAGAFQAMGMLKMLFNIFKFPVISFQFISHRIVRWTICPLALVILPICSVILYIRTGSILYGMVTFLQLILYVSAACGWWYAVRNRHIKIVYPLFYFVFMNFCVFAGLVRFLRKKQSVLWKRAERSI